VLFLGDIDAYLDMSEAVMNATDEASWRYDLRELEVEPAPTLLAAVKAWWCR
jgi:hypothetical protein